MRIGKVILTMSFAALLGVGGCVEGVTWMTDPAGGDRDAAGGNRDAAVVDTSSEDRPAADRAFAPAVCVGAPEVAAGEALLRMVNARRGAVGELQVNVLLMDAANAYACEMIERDFFSHEHPRDGSDVVSRVEAAGYDFQVVGENLAAGIWAPQATVDAWMLSEAHRANLLDGAYSEVGVAVREGGSHGVYTVLILASSAK